MTTMQVPVPRKATKAKRKARIALAGPSGGGKSYTALTIATALPGSGRIVGIDTEKGSMADYADLFEFDHVPIDSYHPELLIAMCGAYAEDYADGVMIVDSMSHFWMGADGMLEQVDNATARSRSGSSFNSGWKDMRPIERRMIEALLAFPGHVIVTMRTKTEWVTEYDERTKKTQPRKIGTKPEQREGIEYEFQLVADLDLDNRLIISKSRMGSGLPIVRNGSVVLRPGTEFGTAIGQWLVAGVETPTAQDYIAKAKDTMTRAALRALLDEIHRANLAGAAVRDGDRALSLRELVIEIGHGLPPDDQPAHDPEPPTPEPAADVEPQWERPTASEMSAATNAAGSVHPRAALEDAERTSEGQDVEAAAEPDGPFGDEGVLPNREFAEEFRNDMAAATKIGQLNPLAVRLQRARRAHEISEDLAAQLEKEHNDRLKAIRAGRK